MKWREEMASLEEKDFAEKDIISLKLENQNLKDLEFLRDQIPPDPSTKPEDVNSFMKDIPKSKDKNNRMFIEIRFQKNTSTAMRKNTVVFRLKNNHQNLDTYLIMFQICITILTMYRKIPLKRKLMEWI